MKNSSLRDLLKDAMRHPPKKLNSSLISDVYSKCSTSEDLDDIISSLFFQSIVWRFFHADVTNSHLQLILQVSAYEYETLSCKTCLEMMQKDAGKLNDLILRVLKSTMTYRKQDTRLQAAIFLFLRVLIVASPLKLINHPFFNKWKSLAFESYSETLERTSFENSDSLLLLHCFLSFSIACVVLSLEECKHVINNLSIPFRFSLESFDFKTKRLASLILLLNPQISSFTSFQIAIEKLGFQGRFPLAEFAALRLDVSSDDFIENLQALPKSDLIRLAEFLGYKQLELTSEVMVVMITHLVLNDGLSYNKLQKYVMFNENDIFDLFEKTPQLPFVPTPTIPSFIPFSESWVEQIKAQNSFKYLTLVNQRAQSVLERLTITDPSADRGIKGSSKYFSEIQALSVNGSKAEISLKNKKITSIITTSDTILLMELQKPGRNSGVNRLVKHGVNACAVSKVVSVSDKLKIEWNSAGFEERFNALIVLPSPLYHTQNSFEEDPVSDTLSNLWGIDPETSTVKLSVDCISEPVLESLGGELITKKRRINEDQTASTPARYKFNSCEITLSQSKEAAILPEDLSVALLAMFRGKVLLKGSRGVSENRLINAFLRTLSINDTHETCLVVMPTKTAVDLFEVEEVLSIFKYDSNNNFALGKIDRIIKNLDKVAALSQHLGLEDYDFLSSIQNGLMLYYLHVEPAWKRFLKLISRNTIASYPFTSIKNNTFEEGLTEIVEDYATIRALFSELEHCLPLDKFNLHNLKDADYKQIREFFTSNCRYLIISEQDLQFVDRSFDNVITHDVSAIPHIKGGFKRIALFGESVIDWGEPCQLSTSETRQEIANLVGGTGVSIHPFFNAGFRYCVQHVKVPSSKQGLNVEEAKYCVALYQYMRLMGYPWDKILIAVKSEHMKYLIEEILLEEKIKRLDRPCDLSTSFSIGWPIIQHLKEISPCDYLIVSCHGSPTWREYKNVGKVSRKGLYMVGAESDYPYKIRSGELEIIKGELYHSDRTSQQYLKVDSDQISGYVDELAKDKLLSKDTTK